MKIDVEPHSWGEAIPSNIEALLADVISHLNRLLVEPVPDHIKVLPVSGADAVPRTLYRYSGCGPITIQLSARDRKWSKFAYQFSHEFCHVLSNFERLRNNPNQWFHEALCELASVFTLRRMAERWPTLPPYPNWADYASALSDYADHLLEDENHQLPEGLTLATWLPMHENELRQDPYLRDKNAIVACRLLPLFEVEPSGWNALRSLPNSSGHLQEYLADWHECVASTDKPFLKRLIGAFQ